MLGFGEWLMKDGGCGMGRAWCEIILAVRVRLESRLVSEWVVGRMVILVLNIGQRTAIVSWVRDFL